MSAPVLTPVTSLKVGRSPVADQPFKRPAPKAPLSPPPEIARYAAGGRGPVYPCWARSSLSRSFDSRKSFSNCASCVASVGKYRMKFGKPATTAAVSRSLGTALRRVTPDGRSSRKSPTSKAMKTAKPKSIQRPHPRFMALPPASRFASRRQQRQQTLERLDVVRRKQPVDVRKGRGHAARGRLVAGIRQQRVQPQHPPCSARERAHRAHQGRRVSPIETVADDQDHGPRVHHSIEVSFREGLQTFADAGSTGPVGNRGGHALQASRHPVFSNPRGQASQRGVE